MLRIWLTALFIWMLTPAYVLGAASGSFTVHMQFIPGAEELATESVPLLDLRAEAGGKPALTVEWRKEQGTWFTPVVWRLLVGNHKDGALVVASGYETVSLQANQVYDCLVSYNASSGEVSYAVRDIGAGTDLTKGAIHLAPGAGEPLVAHLAAGSKLLSSASIFVPAGSRWWFSQSQNGTDFAQVARINADGRLYVTTTSTVNNLPGTFQLATEAGYTTVGPGVPAAGGNTAFPVDISQLPLGKKVYKLGYLDERGNIWSLGEQMLEVNEMAVQAAIIDVKVIDDVVKGVLKIKATGDVTDIAAAIQVSTQVWPFRGEWQAGPPVPPVAVGSVSVAAEEELSLDFAFKLPAIDTDERALMRLQLKPGLQAKIGSPSLEIRSAEVYSYAVNVVPRQTPTSQYNVGDRKLAAKRPRGVIYNNDGNDNPVAPITPYSFLQKRTIGVEKTQVGSIFYCDGIFNMYTHVSKETELLKGPGTTEPGLEPFGWELQQQGFDPLQLVIDYAKANGLEVFWSMRMNDTHDNQASREDWQLSQWKRNNRNLLMSPVRRQFPYGWAHGPSWTWTALNYELPAVRDKMFRIIEDVVTRYDLDGIELDFLRFPIYFKNQMSGLPVTDAQRALMTQLIQDIRKLTESVAERRGRPFLIAVRVIDSIDYSREIGLDIKEWLRQDLVDIIVATDYFRLQPWSHIVSVGQEYDVPVYACVSASRFPADDILPWRAEALRAWEAGASGIYLFNIFRPSHPAFSELGDPDLLRKLPKSDIYTPNSDITRNVESISSWLKGGEKYLSPEVKATYPFLFK